MLDLTGLAMLVDIERPDLKAEPWTPVTPRRLQAQDDEIPDIFEAIRAGDILLHHPYESFANTVEQFLAQAAEDPDVLTIKLSLYRTSGDSPVVRHLIRAAELGKQVVAMVEIKARFDERANIAWARKLEQAGAHVVYGLVGLKTHSKTLLIVRREEGVLRRYVHIGTGNYNSRTARQYVDLGLLTCRSDIGQDVTDLFNILTGLSRQRAFRRLLIAPIALRQRFLAFIDREIEHAKHGRRAGIVLKLNALVDRECIDALYRASAAGVPIDLIIRGGCTLIPGADGPVGPDPGPLDHRRVPRAFPHLALRERRRAELVHRLGRPHGAQPRPANRGPGAGPGPVRSRPSSRPSSRRCSPTTGGPGRWRPTAPGLASTVVVPGPVPWTPTWRSGSGRSRPLPRRRSRAAAALKPVRSSPGCDVREGPVTHGARRDIADRDRAQVPGPRSGRRAALPHGR